MKGFSKVYPNLISGRYFTTIWCTLDKGAFPIIHKYLENIVDECDWLCTFGNGELDAKYIPHISLRYQGFTDELDKNVILENKKQFADAVYNGIKNSKVSLLKLGAVSIWERKEKDKVIIARLSWAIKDNTVLKSIHNELLKVEGFQLIQGLEQSNYSPHISLGQINLIGKNYESVASYLKDNVLPDLDVNISNFAINYATTEYREEIKLDI